MRSSSVVKLPCVKLLRCNSVACSYCLVCVCANSVHKGVGRSFTDESALTPMMHECNPGRRQWLAFGVVHMYNCFISSSRCAVKLYSPTYMYVCIALCIHL